MNALTLLPRLLAWLDRNMTEAPWKQDGPESIWSAREKRADCEILITTPRVFKSDTTLDTEACHCEQCNRNTSGIAALRNALPWLIEMAEDYRDMAAIIAESGYDTPGLLLLAYERIAQRILDAAYRGLLAAIIGVAEAAMPDWGPNLDAELAKVRARNLATDGIEGYLHRKLVPLSEAINDQQAWLDDLDGFDNECEGGSVLQPAKPRKRRPNRGHNMGDKPKWQHDCDRCKFVGSHTVHTINEEGQCVIYSHYDFYVCSSSYVARYGDDGPDYMSAAFSMVDDPRYSPSEAVAQCAIRAHCLGVRLLPVQKPVNF